MNRLEFLNCIKYNCDAKLTDLMTNFFNQYMLLYNLVDTIESVSVVATYENGIVFQLSYSNDIDANRLSEKLLQLPFVDIYEKRYNVSFSKNGNTLTITINSIF